MNPAPAIKIFLVEDHAAYRSALEMALARAGSFEVVGASAAGEDVVALAVAGLVDLVVCDVHLGTVSGLDLCRQLRRLNPKVQVCMLSADTTPETVLESVSAGATGFVHKNTRPSELIELLAAAARGDDAFDQVSAARLASTARRRTSDAPTDVTEVQRTVLRGLADGLSGSVLAERVGLDEGSCQHEVAALLEHFDEPNAAALVARALRSGVIV